MSERITHIYQETIDRFEQILERISSESLLVKSLLSTEDLDNLAKAYTLIEEVKLSFSYLE